MNSVKTIIVAKQVVGAAAYSDVRALAGEGFGSGVVVMGASCVHGYRAGALKQPTKVRSTSDSTHMFIGVEGK